MPGFVEAHGHPLMEAIVLADRIVDIRPVTLRDADDVVTRSGARSPPAEPTARTSTAGTRCCSRACRSRRWRGSTAGPGLPAGDRPQLGTQGVLQHRRRAQSRPDPRHRRPEGRQVRPRRQRRTRRHRRRVGCGVQRGWRGHRAQRVSGDAARRMRAAQQGRIDDVFGDGLLPVCSGRCWSRCETNSPCGSAPTRSPTPR